MLSLYRHPDIHGRAAEKLLQMTPICCLEAKQSPFKENNSSNNNASNSLPTFLVGLGRPSAEDGIAVETASEAMPVETIDYQSYLMDAR